MLNNDMPLGKPTYFEVKDTSLNINSLVNEGKAFGFFNVEITAPENLEHPILQSRVLTKEGWRTVAPLGQWNDVIFSEEMYNAERYGYKFVIKSGYLFNRGNIFKDYINKIYEIKKTTNPSDPMYLISKLLLNSLYGRFGMNFALEDHKILSYNN